jgi:hypothetical protein
LRHNQGRDAAAIQLLRSFQSYVVKYANAEILDEEQADHLWSDADSIIILLSGQKF